MVLGLGLDLCEIGRMEAALARERFLQRVYTPAERARLEVAGARRAEMAAGLFAAKEAAAKALGTGFSGFGPWDIEITPNAAGMPQCALMNGAAAQARRLAGDHYRMLVTITHESGMASAAAVLCGEIPPSTK